MNTTTKTHEVEYFAPSLSDIITLLPVMDSLVSDLRFFNKKIKELRESKEGYEPHEYERDLATYTNRVNNLFNQISILKQMGFSTSNNNRDIETPQEIRI